MRNLNLFGPPGICDNCGRACCVLHQAGSPTEPGIECYHCGAGNFRHRSLWNFVPCDACAGQNDPLCETCHGSRVIATPRDNPIP